MGRIIDLTGKRFGRLFVEARAGTRDKRPLWSCLCDCGQEALVRGEDLRYGQTQSCGCLHREMSSDIYAALNLRHGKTGSPEHISWQQMIQRCTNPNHHAWKHYGGRGISVCARWLDSFEAFYEDMGSRPMATSIDRIDVNGNYEPGNCRWADAKTQRANRRDSVVTHG